MTDEDSSLNPRITAFLYSPENDVPEQRQYFEETPIPKTKYSREYTLVLECINTSHTHMRVIIPEVDNSDSSFYKRMDISNLSVGKLRKGKDQK
jgi:hypothetical protein